ncbi:hypothetical protein [Pseudomonas sp.]|uniref:hypothetical protein n=1 Tax=Pseudomonas sp. TaxID=306 RepID=UPI002914C8EB|nr:hypothetical protein [Pseudomonas sp.]MDU4254473.1 hypothetical protein [Pseudomonas sp.]
MSSEAANPDKQPAALPHQGQPQADQQATDAKSGKLKRTRKVVRWVLAIDAWKKQFGLMKHRARFPLLRRVIAIEREKRTNLIQLADVPTDVLEKSLISHCFILLFTVPAAGWAVYLLIKTLAAWIRFDVFLFQLAIQGIPLLAFALMKSLTSNKTRKLILSELRSRATNTVKE